MVVIDEGLCTSEKLPEPLNHLFPHPLFFRGLEMQNCKQGLTYVLGISWDPLGHGFQSILLGILSNWFFLENARTSSYYCYQYDPILFSTEIQQECNLMRPVKGIWLLYL